MKRPPYDIWLMYLAALVVVLSLLSFWIMVFFKMRSFMHLIETIWAGLVVLGIGVIALSVFTAEPDPEDREEK